MDNGDNFVLTAILCAAEEGDLKNLTDLLKTTNLDVNKGNKNKETALHLAAANGRKEIVKLLALNNMRLDVLDLNGESALHYCCRCNNQESAKEIIEFLISNGISINSQNRNGESALHIATRYGYIEIAKYLCKLGINLDFQDDQLETSLHLASWHGYPELVDLFCKSYCDINKRNKEGETALIVACARGCIESVRTLVEYKADLNYRDKRGNSALHWAVKRHYTMIALLLIQAGCNMNILDSNGETALHIACRENLLSIIQAMCAFGCRVDIKNKREMTPLHTAIEKNEINAVRCLCLAGQDLTLKNKDGLTAEQLANNLKFYEIATLLSSLRKDLNRESCIEQLIPTTETLKRLKIKVLGSSGTGKSTLIGSMNCSYLNSFFRKSRLSSKSSIKNSKSPNSLNSMKDKKNSIMTNLYSTSLSSYWLEPINDEYTKGIEINQCTLAGSNSFSVWEFSGYEPYRLAYENFLAYDSLSSIHLILYNLNESLDECFGQCVYWLEFLRSRARVKTEDELGNLLDLTDTKRIYLTQLSSSSLQNTIKVIFIGTHVDLEPESKREDGIYYSPKAIQLQNLLDSYYANDNVFDLTNRHYCIDSRAAWESDIKLLISNLVQLKQDICERLPKCTVFLNKTLASLKIWRKSFAVNSQKQSSSPNASVNANSYDPKNVLGGLNYNLTSTTYANSRMMNNNTVISHLGKYPILRLNHFIDLIREIINPLADEVHLFELISQLQIMGEIILIEKNIGSKLSSCSSTHFSSDFVCLQPEWLCHLVIGNFYSFERLKQIQAKNLNGIYSADDLLTIFSGICDDLSVLENIFISLGVCATVENELTGRIEFEFPSMNFSSLENENPFSKYANNKIYFTNINHIRNDKTINEENENNRLTSDTKYVFTGYRLHSSAYHLKSISSIHKIRVPNQLINLFFKLQTGLRNIIQNSHDSDFDDVTRDERFNDKNNTSSVKCNYANLNNHKTSSPNLMNPQSYCHDNQFYNDLATNRESISDINHTGDNKHDSKLIKHLNNNQAFSGSSISLNNALNINNTNNRLYLMNRLCINRPKSNSFLLRSHLNTHRPNQASTTQNTRYENLLSGNDLYIKNKISKKNSSLNRYFGTIIDFDIFQYRFSSRLVRENCKIDCLIRFDDAENYIEVRACAPESLNEELFYFVEDLHQFIVDTLNYSNISMNLERHYISFRSDVSTKNENNIASNIDRLRSIQIDLIFRPEDIIRMQLRSNSNSEEVSNGLVENKIDGFKEIKFVDIVCCGSETIRKNLTLGANLSLCYLNTYTRRILCMLLDKIDPMGRDCNILAVLLGLEEYLPKIDQEMQTLKSQHLIDINISESLNINNKIIRYSTDTSLLVSKCDCVLNEWCKRRPEQANIRNLILKLDEFGRKDCKEIVMNTAFLFQVNRNHDSGIQNSSQTLC